VRAVRTDQDRPGASIAWPLSLESAVQILV
jgi:hypothetical protein